MAPNTNASQAPGAGAGLTETILDETFLQMPNDTGTTGSTGDSTPTPVNTVPIIETLFNDILDGDAVAQILGDKTPEEAPPTDTPAGDGNGAKSNKMLFWIIGIVAALLLIVILYFVFRKKKQAA